MGLFIGAAREQVERILEYVAAPGAGILVARVSGDVLVACRKPTDELRLRSAARAHAMRDEPVLLHDGGHCISGSVGFDYIVAFELDEALKGHAAPLDRVSKACTLLTRMLRPPPTLPGSASGSPDGGGSPAEAVLALPAWRDDD